MSRPRSFKCGARRSTEAPRRSSATSSPAASSTCRSDMDLHLTSEQTLLRDSAAKFIAVAGPKVARGLRGCVPSFAPGELRQAGELGWLGMLVPSSADGLGLGLTELALVLEQAGRGLVCEPIGLAAISRGRFSARPCAASDAATRHARRRAGDAGTAGKRARQRSACTAHAGNWRPRAAFDRNKMSVCADGADGFLVSASGADGPALYYVRARRSRCECRDSADRDGRNLATLR